MTRPRRTVLVFVKPPRMGLSKTRLARDLGPAEARRIAWMCQARTARATRDPRWRTELYTTPDRALEPSACAAWPADVARRSQGGGDLGARLARGLRAAPRGPVLLIGADTPDITRGRIWDAFRTLHQHDAVFGPARDGGFWLFGLRRPIAGAPLFEGVRWSSPHTLEDLSANLPAGFRIAWLDTLRDIDEAADWWAWRAARGR